MTRVRKCKACGADIIFIGTGTGKYIPCNVEQIVYWENKGGRGKVVSPNGEVINCDFEGIPEKATGIGYISHFATCPAANNFRKAGKRK